MTAAHPRPGRSLAERIAAIDMLLLDVDGVLTDGRIVYSDSGEELKRFHVRDGAALKVWRKAGKKAGILTGRASAAVTRRAEELSLDVIVQGAEDKRAAFQQILRDQSVRADAVCYVGDDLPDLPVLARCGLAVAVADGCAEALAAADYVTRRPGGAAAVREVIELILHGQGLWNKIVERLRA